MFDFRVALRFKTNDVRFALPQIFVNLLFREISAMREFAVVTGKQFVFRLIFARFFQLLFRTEAGIGKSATNQVFGERMINFRALPLVNTDRNRRIYRAPSSKFTPKYFKDL